jgi:nucleoside-diphosphate-sugar epimerase
LKPQSPYAETKLKEEDLVQSLARHDGLPAIVFRFGTIFGASVGMRYHTAVNKFCWQAVMNQPLTIWKSAYDQKRPYLDLIDAVRATAFVIKHDLFDGRIYNVLTLNATVRDIVECIREFVPDLQLSFVKSPIMNQMSYEVSCGRFLDQGFVFSGDVRRGIRETLELLAAANQRLNLLSETAPGLVRDKMLNKVGLPWV